MAQSVRVTQTQQIQFSDFGSLKAYSRRRWWPEIRAISLARCHLKTSEVSAVAQIWIYW